MAASRNKPSGLRPYHLIGCHLVSASFGAERRIKPADAAALLYAPYESYGSEAGPVDMNQDAVGEQYYVDMNPDFTGKPVSWYGYVVELHVPIYRVNGVNDTFSITAWSYGQQSIATVPPQGAYLHRADFVVDETTKSATVVMLNVMLVNGALVPTSWLATEEGDYVSTGRPANGLIFTGPEDAWDFYQPKFTPLLFGDTRSEKMMSDMLKLGVYHGK
jgi:hypothetical protein